MRPPATEQLPDHLTERFEALEERITDLEHELEQKEHRIDDLEATLEQQDEQLEEIEQDCDRLEKATAAALNKATANKERVTELQSRPANSRKAHTSAKRPLTNTSSRFPMGVSNG